MNGMPKSNSILRLLSAVPSLAGLKPPALEQIARHAVRREYEEGQIVFLEGEPAVGLYVVESGWLKAIKLSSSGREQVLRVVGPGDAFNEVALFIESPNPATVVALEPASVVLIRREPLLQLLDEHPAIARIAAQQLAQRVLYLLTIIEDLSLRPVEARLARLLLEQAVAGVIHRRRWATQSEIAARIGTVPDVLSRAIRNLTEEGLIQVERHQIRILDPEGLKARALLP
jgi:CRP/FNR family transcriptional regulator